MYYENIGTTVSVPAIPAPTPLQACQTQNSHTVFIYVYIFSYYSNRVQSLQCIQGVASGCSQLVKHRILTHLEWSNSMVETFGVCSEEMPKFCDPHGAMECISKLGTGHLLASGTDMEPAICA